MKVYTLNWYYDSVGCQNDGIVGIYSDLTEAEKELNKLTLEEETLEGYPSLAYCISEYTLK
jgi:hypothetical protein